MMVVAEERVSVPKAASNRRRGARQPTNKQSLLSRLPVAVGGDYHRERQCRGLTRRRPKTDGLQLGRPASPTLIYTASSQLSHGSYSNYYYCCPLNLGYTADWLETFYTYNKFEFITHVMVK